MAFSILRKKTVDTKGKVRWIGLRNPGEDGLICVAIILSYHNIKCSLRSLRKRYPQFSKGVTLRGIMDLLKVNGLQSRALSCPIEDVDKLALPCILHWNMQQFVVLAEINNDIFHVSDPASRRSRYTREAFECNFSEVALEVYK
jgi:ATP-binding cassette, subfamily B, bacterial CvaB/MchF/RaxB